MKDGNKYIESISFGSQILERLGNIEVMQKEGFIQVKEDFLKVNDHLKELNSKTAKNSGWIERYDIRVAEEVPRHIVETKNAFESTKVALESIKIQLAKWGGGIAVLIVVINYIFSKYFN